MATSDAEMMEATAAIVSSDFAMIEVVQDGEHHMLIRFTIEAEPGVFAIRLPLPSSRELKPWLYTIPDNADAAAGMLTGFVDEEVATGCAHWAATTLRESDRRFELAPYGFRRADQTEHRRLLKAAGSRGWSGMIHEDDDPPDTPASRKLARLATLPLTYPEVGATGTSMPTGYHTIDVAQRIGTGRDWFGVAVERLMSWEMHRRAGLLVGADRRVTVGGIARLGIRIGPWWIDAPVRIIEVIDTPTVAGFAYGTLPGHPETGEERFLVHLDPSDNVRAEIRAFSRPGRWFSRLAGPLGRRIQRATTVRYLAALSDNPGLDRQADD